MPIRLSSPPVDCRPESVWTAWPKMRSKVPTLPERVEPVLALDVEQEALVAGVAHQRRVAVPVGDELQRLGAAHVLVTGLEVDLLVLL